MKRPTDDVVIDMTLMISDIMFPIADGVEEFFQKQCNDPISADVEAFLLFGNRLVQQGWDYEDLVQMVEEVLKDVEVEKVVVQ